MSEAYALVNGQLAPLRSSSVPLMDLGFLRGLAVFETVRTYAGGCPYALGPHLKRLWEGASAIGVPMFFTETTLRAEIRAAYEASEYQEVSINIVVTPGVLTGGYFDSDEPSRVVIVRQVPAGYDALRETGVGVSTFEAERMLPGVKTTNYVQGRIGLERARREGSHEAIYRDERGYVREGVTSNIMARFGNTIVSPDEHCLQGITSRSVRVAAEQTGLEWKAGGLTVESLRKADEVWLSSTLREIVPVVRVDGHPIGEGAVGDYFNDVYEVFGERCRKQSLSDAGRTAS